MPNRELLIDKLNSLPPEQRDPLTKIIKQSLQGMLTAPNMPQVQSGTTGQPTIPTAPRRQPAKPKMIITDSGEIDEEALIQILSTLPT